MCFSEGFIQSQLWIFGHQHFDSTSHMIEDLVLHIDLFMPFGGNEFFGCANLVGGDVHAGFSFWSKATLTNEMGYSEAKSIMNPKMN